MKKGFKTPIEVRVIDEPPYKYELITPLKYHTDLDGGLCIEVDVGFKTDFASVPRVPFVYSVFGDLTKAAGAAVIHDALYRYHLKERKFCDDVFYEAMRVSGMGWFKSRLMHWAVRTFGSFSASPPKDNLAHMVRCSERHS